MADDTMTAHQLGVAAAELQPPDGHLAAGVSMDVASTFICTLATMSAVYVFYSPMAEMRGERPCRGYACDLMLMESLPEATESGSCAQSSFRKGRS